MFTYLLFLYFSNYIFYELLEDPNINFENLNPKGCTTTKFYETTT